MYTSTSPTASTAVGYRAMYLNSSGDNNVAVGRDALYSNSTASNNIAVGYQAGYLNTTGDRNVSMGNYALYSNIAGQYNTAVGYQALTNAVNSYNTAFGYLAAYGLTNGSQNVYIGYASTQSGTSVTGEIVLGASITGKGSNTAFIGGTSGAYNGANTTTWSTTSDQRLKKNIADNNDGLDKINLIRVRNFEYRLAEEITELPSHSVINKTGVQLGVIAQELQAILPDCVKTESTGVLTVNSDNLVWYLVNAVKQLKAEIDELKGNV
jgi:hypothetical protein